MIGLEIHSETQHRKTQGQPYSTVILKSKALQ